MANPFLDTTAVRATGPGRYEGSIHAEWNLNPLPQGGVVTAVALRAMAEELERSRPGAPDPAHHLRRPGGRRTGHRRGGAAPPGPVDVPPPGRGGQRRCRPGPPDHRHLRRPPAAASTSPTSSHPTTSRPPASARPSASRPRPGWRGSRPCPSGTSWSRVDRCGAILPGRSTARPGRAGHVVPVRPDRPASTTAPSTPWPWWSWPTPCPGRWARRWARPAGAGSPRASTSPCTCSTTAGHLGAGPQPGPLRR